MSFWAVVFHINMKAGDGTLAAYEVIRSKVGYMKEDRILSKDIAVIKELLLSGEIVKAVENKVGKLY